jgi:membrane peptidoglycan carboxypeptidase
MGRPRRAAAPSRIPRILAILLLALVLLASLAAGSVGLATVAAVGALSTDLPDPATLGSLTFSQPTVIYDRTGEIQLGVFQREKRRVVTYKEVPHLVVDATTTAEDRSFWTNAGFDPAAILAAAAENANGQSDRGASTITQQLVRARLLPDGATAAGADRYVRKAKELIQSSRLTTMFPGESGKESIVTAYLNEIFYGHDAYGIAAAAQIYFGVTDLSALTPAQAALLAGLPKSPSTLDPYRYAEPDAEGRLVVPPTAPPVVRRDWILNNLSTSRWTTLNATELQNALDEPVVLVGDVPLSLKAPHFTWQVRRQLDEILKGREPVETGGYKVITTLDWNIEAQAERWLGAAGIAPNMKPGDSKVLLDQLKIGAGDRTWINALRGKDLHDAALVTIDYKTGDVLAYSGSAAYYRDGMASKKFNPKYDAAGAGARQPGSAWKPIVYATAFDNHALTPGSLLLDVTTEFDRGAHWAPRDADQLDRGPVLVRRALQYSLNIPAIRALQRVGSEAVADKAEALGIRFTGGKQAFLQAGLAGAIGTVEVRPLDLASAYGALANEGYRVPPRMILEVRDASGAVIYKAPDPTAPRTLSAQAAYLVTDILSGNTDPKQNPIWAEKLEIHNGPKGEHRPIAVKTGTANDARDLATYGYLAPPADPKAPGLVVGIWMGNSDHSMPSSSKPATSLTAAAPLWRAFVRDITAGTPVAAFPRPAGLVNATIDAWSGGKPGSWTRDTTKEWFIDGTQPGAKDAVDPDGLLYSLACGGWRVDALKAELGPHEWDYDVANWLSRARHGPGTEGRLHSRTAYFWGERSWGGPLIGACAKPKPTPPKDKPPKDEQPRQKPPHDENPGPPAPPAP